MTEVAKLYGGSLYDLAAEEGLEDVILDEFGQVNALFDANPDWLRLLNQPNVPKKERCAMLDEAFGQAGVQPYLVNFLKLLCERGSLNETKGCEKEYRSRYNAAHGIVEVTAVTAAPLTDSQKTALTAKLEAMTGKKIQLNAKLDKSVLGGIRLDMDGKRLDGTVQHRLDALNAAIQGVML